MIETITQDILLLDGVMFKHCKTCVITQHNYPYLKETAFFNLERE